MSSRMVSLPDYEIGVETEAAIGLWDGSLDKNNRKVLVWVPRVLVQFDDDGQIMVSEKIAIEKELI